jgi:hypothetical protein
MQDASNKVGMAALDAPPATFDPVLDAALDEALMETFPASDPVAVSLSVSGARVERSLTGAEPS